MKTSHDVSTQSIHQANQETRESEMWDVIRDGSYQYKLIDHSGHWLKHYIINGEKEHKWKLIFIQMQMISEQLIRTLRKLAPKKTFFVKQVFQSFLFNLYKVQTANILKLWRRKFAQSLLIPTLTWAKGKPLSPFFFVAALMISL